MKQLSAAAKATFGNISALYSRRCMLMAAVFTATASMHCVSRACDSDGRHDIGLIDYVVGPGSELQELLVGFSLIQMLGGFEKNGKEKRKKGEGTEKSRKGRSGG